MINRFDRAKKSEESLLGSSTFNYHRGTFRAPLFEMHRLKAVSRQTVHRSIYSGKNLLHGSALNRTVYDLGGRMNSPTQMLPRV